MRRTHLVLYVALLLVEATPQNAGAVWTGGNNIFSDQQWRWLSNYELIGQYEPWYDPNPSNSNGNENCIEIRRDGGYMWNDINCNVQNAFICEKSPTYVST